MAGKPEENDGSLSPPPFAEALVRAAAEPADKTALIGDLYEEYGRLCAGSTRDARRWYWRQTAASLPRLLWNRLRHRRVLDIGLVFLATLGAYVMAAGWEIAVARNAAGALARSMEAPSFLLIRGFYLFIQMIGVAAGGAIIAWFTFHADKTFVQNVMSKLMPMIALLFLPPILGKLFSQNTYPLSYTAIWITLAAPSLIAGAWIGARLKKRF